MKTFTILFLLPLAISAVAGVSFFDVVVQEWESWKLLHGRSYNSTTEDKFRLKVFMDNSVKISKHNVRAQRGEHSYFLKMNHFGDMLHHEFASLMNGLKGEKTQKGATFIPPENVVLPQEIDWRTKGAVTPVKNQGQCGSCWAFSTTGSLEGQDFRKTGKLISLSEQNLIDCSKKFGNNGCNGGLMDNAFEYIKKNKGIDTEASYPYIGEDREQCRYNPAFKGGSDIGFVDITHGSEKDLQTAVATIGPISVAIDASHESFQFYSHGVYDEENCSSEQLDHGVLVVGYGVDEVSGHDYWLIKNSWSKSWGEEGYVKMTRNKNNMCGVASMASYPLV